MAPRTHTARRTRNFRHSAIREMMQLAAETHAIDLGPGIPDHPTPDRLKRAACAAIRGNRNQYEMTCGGAALRHALADHYARRYGMDVDPDREVTVTCGATEGLAAAMLALLDPGDDVVVMEPFFESFGSTAEIAGVRAVHVPLNPPEYRIDRRQLEAAITPRTAAILVNSPNNPTGDDRKDERDDRKDERPLPPALTEDPLCDLPSPPARRRRCARYDGAVHGPARRCTARSGRVASGAKRGPSVLDIVSAFRKMSTDRIKRRLASICFNVLQECA